MNIFVTGQTTLHWGRMEFGNIGNYYIAEPFFEELRKNFPDSIIRTTLQFSNMFLNKYNIEMVPKEQYFDFNSDNNLIMAKKELTVAEAIAQNDEYIESQMSDYLRNCIWCDCFIDLSGDIWGKNADFLGKDRFEVGLIKDKVAQVLGKKTFMIAGSPGPFNDKTIDLAREVYKGFTLVTNREPISTKILTDNGFLCDKTQTFPCPSFLFEPGDYDEAEEELKKAGLREDDRPIVGFILCGWDFETGPFDKWPREDKEYEKFVYVIDKLCKEINCKVCLLSHSNGFPIPPKKFELLHGRDYPIIKQLQRILTEKGINVYALDGVYGAKETKAIIGQFDMLVSGRVHGAVAGLSQAVPTVIIDYGHEPKAHKLLGFATVAGQQEFLANPNDEQDLFNKIKKCWDNRDTVNHELAKEMITIKKNARKQFTLVAEIMKGNI